MKLASVKLAVKYIKRVSGELEMVGGGPEEELIVQGVEFAFLVHQFAGGFDVETMKAFEELRDKARLQYQMHHQPKPISSSWCTSHGIGAVPLWNYKFPVYLFLFLLSRGYCVV